MLFYQWHWIKTFVIDIYLHVFLCLGVLYRDAGNIALAIEAYERCLHIDPDSRNAGQVLFSANLILAPADHIYYFG